jgi:hypothetical protein
LQSRCLISKQIDRQAWQHAGNNYMLGFLIGRAHGW